jgi:hypothetical protein
VRPARREIVEALGRAGEQEQPAGPSAVQQALGDAAAEMPGRAGDDQH